MSIEKALLALRASVQPALDVISELEIAKQQNKHLINIIWALSRHITPAADEFESAGKLLEAGEFPIVSNLDGRLIVIHDGRSTGTFEDFLIGLKK